MEKDKTKPIDFSIDVGSARTSVLNSLIKEEPELYEVWGWDTFSNEEYFCGSFKSLKEAEAEVKRCEKRVAKSQDESLRDTFSILNPQRAKECQEARERWRETLEDARKYDPDQLERYIVTLLKKQVESCIAYSPEKQYRNSIAFTNILRCRSESNCFSRLKLIVCKERNEDNCSVRLQIYFRNDNPLGGGNTSLSVGWFDSVNELLEWSKSKESIDRCLEKAKEGIYDFFEN